MSSFDIQALLNPINDTAPCGEDARYEFCYELMEAEVKKFGSLFGETVNWNSVEENALVVLKDNSKDLKAFSYLVRAWMERGGAGGLFSGLSLINSALDLFGTELFPKRRRGRDGAIEWLTRQIELAVQKMELSKNDIGSVQQSATLCNEISFKISEVFPDSEVSLFSIRDQLSSLVNRATFAEHADVEPVIEEKKTNNTEPEIASDTEKTAPIEAGKEKVLPSIECKQTQAVVQPAAVVQTPVVKQPKPVSAVAAPASLETDFSSSDEARRSLERIAEYLISSLPSHPLAYQVYRFITWDGIDDLPVHGEDGVTPLMLPISVEKHDEYEAVLNSGQAESVYKKLEKSLINAPFWLSGQKLQHDYLQSMGLDDAAEAVKSAAMHFVQRVPNIETLKFHDGRPFADDSTQKWLTSSIIRPVEITSSHSDLDSLEIEKVDLENLGTVVKKVSEALKNPNSGRENFLMHLRLAQVYQFAGLSHLVLSHIEVIWPQKEAFNLASWEPQLCSQLDSLALLTLKELFVEEELVPEKYKTWLSISHS